MVNKFDINGKYGCDKLAFILSCEVTYYSIGPNTEVKLIEILNFKHLTKYYSQVLYGHQL